MGQAADGVLLAVRAGLIHKLAAAHGFAFGRGSVARSLVAGLQGVKHAGVGAVQTGRIAFPGPAGLQNHGRAEIAAVPGFRFLAQGRRGRRSPFKAEQTAVYRQG